jgi:hypothetical protein
MTDREIANLLGCGEATLYRWKLKFFGFSRALKLGKATADDRVERSLFHRAVGYSYDEQKVIGGHRVTVRRQMPPDTAAAIFYLKNRRPDRWHDVQRQEHGRPGEFDHIDDAAQLRALLTRRAQQLGLAAPTVKADPRQSAEKTAPPAKKLRRRRGEPSA